jgi:hypothetical protein
MKRQSCSFVLKSCTLPLDSELCCHIVVVSSDRDDLGVHMVGFYILSGRNDVRNVCRSYMGHLSDKTEEICKKFSKEASAVVPNMLNFDEFYLIRGGRHLKTETSEMEAGATKGQLLREFRKAQNKRGASRTILARFIEKIAIAS